MPESDRPLRVFLCYSSNDKLIVRDLYRRLDAEGWIDAWLDSEKLYPGQDWNFEIEKAVETADVILVCITKNSVNKEGYVQRELRIVLDLADYKPEGTLFVIPVRLEECDPPRRLRTWQYADYFPENDRDRSYQRLLVSLKMRARKLELSTETPLEVTKRLEAEKLALGQVEPAKEKARLDALELERLAGEEKKRKEAEDRVLQEIKEKERQDKEEHERQAAEELARHKVIVDENPDKPQQVQINKGADSPSARKASPKRANGRGSRGEIPWRSFGIVAGILFAVTLGLVGLSSLFQNVGKPETPTPTATDRVISLTSSPTLTRIAPTATDRAISLTSSPTLTRIAPTANTETNIPSTSNPALGIGSTMVSPKDDMVMVYVPAGEFTMGSDADDALAECQKFRSDCQRSWFTNEEPSHTVYLDAFWFDQTEVTNKQYQACVDAGVCEPPSPISSYTHPNYYGNPEFDDYPVIYVNWDKANRYCEIWSGGDLPTEAQWEKAARGTDARIYPWGNDEPNKDLLNYNANIGDTTAVKNYPNADSFYGTYDMAGNVWEWVNDWYDETYYQSLNSTNNPLGPESGQNRVLRGGAWNYDDYVVRSAYRARSDPAYANYNFGFRCSHSP